MELEEALLDADNWRCPHSCGARCQPLAKGEWRWDGRTGGWQHYHGKKHWWITARRIDMGRTEPVEVMGVLKAATGKAMLLDTGDGEHWIPRSQATLISGDDEKVGEELVIEIPEWLAIEKGLD